MAIVTNLETTKIYDTLTRKEVTTLPSLTSYYDRKLTLDEELKSEALRTLFKLDFEFLQDFCLSQRKIHMMHLLGSKKSRFSEGLYLNRKEIEDNFKAFLNSNEKCFLLVGRQGTGKTFSMVSLAQSIGEKQPVLFYDLPYVPSRIGETIEEDFCWGSKQRTWYGDIINQIDSILKKHNTQMIIFIDSINEAGSKHSVKIDIIDFVRRIYNTSIKLCIACRIEDWKFFYYDKGEPGIFSSLLYHKFEQTSELEQPLNDASIKIDDFSEIELDSVFPKYKQVFDLKTGLSAQARLSCKHPETLRMVSEIFAHKDIPLSLRRKKILEIYWRKKMESIGTNQIAEQLLSKIGKAVLEKNNLEISEKSIVEMVPWGSAYQEVYLKAISENLLVSRIDRFGENYVRISPNLLLEYVLGKNLVELYNSGSNEKKEIVLFIDEISQKLKEFPLYEGALLLFCSLMGNPTELVFYMLERFEPSKLIDQIIDETPEILQSMLNDNIAREKIGKAFLQQEVSIIKPVLSKLLEKYTNAKLLAVELLIYPGHTTKNNFAEFLTTIFSAPTSPDLFISLDEKAVENIKLFSVLIWKAHIACNEIAYKIVNQLGADRLGNLLSLCKEKESPRFVFFISRIDKEMSKKLDPEGKLLAEFNMQFENKQIKLPMERTLFRKEPTRVSITIEEEIISLLNSSFEGFTWDEITNQTRLYKYSILASLEDLSQKGQILRQKKEDQYKYKINVNFDPFRGFAKPLFAELDPSIQIFAKSIIESGFDEQKISVDTLLENNNLGKYFSSFTTWVDFSYEINSYSIDIASIEGKNELEIHGKTFSFWISFLNKKGGLGKSVAFALVKNMSASAPKMLKNYVFGIRGTRHHRQSNTKISNTEQLHQRLAEFNQFFGSVGVRTPTEEEILNECIAHLNKLVDADGKIRDIKSIGLYDNLKSVFNKPILKEIEQKIDRSLQVL